MADPIDNMPPDLLQKCISPLPQRQAAQTAAVSKICKHAWSTRELDFNDLDYGEYLTPVATRTLQRYEAENLKVVSFRIWSATVEHEVARDLIRRALNLGARHLTIYVGPTVIGKFIVPEDVLVTPQPI
ncbi:hypothetical protein AAHA92_13011 [Salvia divinorum]|uniref:F-box domain-containing protein n=1 Tax=Salvia divinorum TaxID=28513 RepID=A0ABD1H6X2_SALDI